MIAVGWSCRSVTLFSHEWRVFCVYFEHLVFVCVSHCRQEAKSHHYDQRPQSLVVVDESSTRALFNFLICNSRQLVAAIGPQAGLPPTILSPAAFCGATLCSIKVGNCSDNFTNDLSIKKTALWLVCLLSDHLVGETAAKLDWLRAKATK